MADAGAAPPMIPIPSFIGQISGPLVLGYSFNWGLFGVLIIQVYIYYLSFPRDPALAKIIVYGLFAIETAQTIINTHDLFKMFGPGYGNLLVLGQTHLSGLGVPILSGIISCTVQCYYAYRITVLSKSIVARVTGILVVMIALMQCGAAIAGGAQAFILGQFAELQKEAHVSTTIWLAGSAACDIIIAVAMTYYLWSAKTGFRSTKVLLTKLVRLTIETGTITAAFAIIDMALFLGFPNNNYHTTPALCLGKIYSNTLLVMLNSRSQISRGREELYSGSVNDSNAFNSVLQSTHEGTTMTGTNGTNGTLTNGTLIKGIEINRETYSESMEMESRMENAKSQWHVV